MAPDSAGGRRRRRTTEGTTVACLKGRKEAKKQKGNFRCKNCGAVTRKKKRLCKPKKIK